VAVVVDANIGVSLVINLDYSGRAQQLMLSWREKGTELLAPSLWWYEVVSALRKAVVARFATETDIVAALADLAQLGIRTVEPTLETHRLALAWAARLEQSAAYDGQYLALAEQRGAEFWTADRQLAQRARAHAPWVHWIQAAHAGP
jgi:predicted nucleic acid-binding protein